MIRRAKGLRIVVPWLLKKYQLQLAIESIPIVATAPGGRAMADRYFIYIGTHNCSMGWYLPVMAGSRLLM